MNPAFFGLNANPFGPTADPAFLYFTPGHREALAHLVFGVQERRGFILLTGEVGTGKTTLLHALLERLGDNVATAFVTNSSLPFDGILEYVLEDLGINKAGASQAQRLFALQTFLLERHRVGQDTVLILDEAQNLSAATLERVRLLSNFETPREKILQIVLAGQPELRATLERPEIRQLKQRIALHCALPRLSSRETSEYVRSRLRTAGAQDPALFSERALERIAAYAAGVPRVINTLCDQCLIAAYADQTHRIDISTVEETISYLDADTPSKTTHARRPRTARGSVKRPARTPRWKLGAACITAAVGIAALLGGPSLLGVEVSHELARRWTSILSTAQILLAWIAQR